MKRKFMTGFIAGISAMLAACGSAGEAGAPAEEIRIQAESCVSVEEVPEYEGIPYVEINDNEPEFTESEMTTESYEEYSDLDELGRCGEAEACIGDDLMPTEEREDISGVTPAGWVNREYEEVEGGYLYNRCHLIGFQLSGENANEENLITGTRYMNVEGMLPFENMVAEYVRDTDYHVMYRVTPVYEGDNLVASGVQMEAESVEDEGAGICFNVYVYNVQPDITIDYATGENWESGVKDQTDREERTEQAKEQYIVNENTDKFHLPECSGVQDIKEKNKREFTGTKKELSEAGYEPCDRCKP